MTGANPQQAAEQRARFYQLDALRAAALLITVAFHAALPFLSNSSAHTWAVRDVHTSPLVNVLVRLPRPMEVFFVLAGIFAGMLYARLGPRGFMLQRVQRILIPFVFAVLVPASLTRALWSAGRFIRDPEQASRDIWAAVQNYARTGRLLAELSTVHVWFLYYLLILYAIAVAVLSLGRRRIPAGLVQQIGRWFERLMRAPLKPFLLAPLTLVFLYPQASWWMHAPFSFVPEPLVLGYYAIFFAVGWAIHRKPRTIDALKRHALPYLLAAIAIAPFTRFFMSKEFGPPVDPGRPLWHMCALVCSTTYTWLMVLGLLGLFSRLFSRQNSVVRYLADSSYWVYLLHLPVVVYVQLVLCRADLPILTKYSIILAVTFGTLLPAYQLFVRHTWIGALLNGPRPLGSKYVSQRLDSRSRIHESSPQLRRGA